MRRHHILDPTFKLLKLPLSTRITSIAEIEADSRESRARFEVL